MNQELLEKVRKGLAAGAGGDALKAELVGQGFLEDEVVDAIQEISGVSRSADEKKNIRLFTIKEIFDRIGYGFSSVQFINILFYLTGAGFLLVGVINGLKTIISLFISSFLHEYSKIRSVSKKFMSKAGILFGISFLIIAVAIVTKSLLLFSIALLAGSIGVVSYGDLYSKLSDQLLKREKLSKFLLGISHYGVLITGACLLAAGFLFEKFPLTQATRILIAGKALPVHGYLIAFEITAISFILSGYVLYFLEQKKDDIASAKGFFIDYLKKIGFQFRQFLQNKYLVLLLLASAVTGIVQLLGNSYYGIFIYERFKDVMLGGFMNVAIILFVAILVSFLGPAISKYLNTKVGLAPALVFGSLLLALMPLVSAFNPQFMNVAAANALSILGAAILGVGQGLLVRKLLSEEHRKLFFAALSVMVIIPFIILVPAGAWLAQTYGLTLLFKVLAFILIVVVAPIYFILVLMANKARL